MKRFLNLLIAFAMVFSLFSGYRVETAKAALGDITVTAPGLATYKYWNAGAVEVTNARVITMGDVISGRVDLTGSALPAGNYGFLVLLDLAGNIVASTPVNSLGNFALQTTSAIRDGLYWIQYVPQPAANPPAVNYWNEPAGNNWNIYTPAPVLGTYNLNAAVVYPAAGYNQMPIGGQAVAFQIKYIFVPTSPSAISKTCLSFNWTGWVKTGGGSTAIPVGQVVTYKPDATVGNFSAIGSDGSFAHAVVVDQVGTYNTIVIDGYDNNLVLPQVGHYIYHQISTGVVTITLKLYIDPTLLYNSGIDQNVAVYAVDQEGNGVSGIPDLAWIVSGGTLNEVYEIGSTYVPPTAAGVYNFNITPAAAGAVTISLVNYSYGGTVINTSVVVKVLPMSNFNPQVYFWNSWADDTMVDPSRRYDGNRYVYGKVPCSIGYFLPISMGFTEYGDGRGYESLYGYPNDVTWDARATVSGPLERMSGYYKIYGVPSYYYNVVQYTSRFVTSKWVDESWWGAQNNFYHMYNYRYLVTGPGTIKIIIRAKIWQKLPDINTVEYYGDWWTGDSSLPLWNPSNLVPSGDNLRYNACCIEKEQAFTICTLASCKTDITSSTTASVPSGLKVAANKVVNKEGGDLDVSAPKVNLTVGDKTNISVAVTQDPATTINCGCNIIVHIKSIYPTPSGDMFTWADGVTKSDELWFNPAGKIPEFYTSAPATTDPFNTTFVGNVVTFKNITVNHSANVIQAWALWAAGTNGVNGIMVEVFGEKLTQCPFGTSYPAVLYDPIAIQVWPPVTTMTTQILNSKVANPTKMVAGVTETLNVSGFTPVSGIQLAWDGIFGAYYSVDQGFTDMGYFSDGPYQFGDLGGGVLQTTISPAFDRDGTGYFDFFAIDGDSMGEATVEVVKPDFKIEIKTSSGEVIPNDWTITEGFIEEIIFSATDPRDSTIKLEPTSAFAMHTGIGEVFYGFFDYGNDYSDWPVASCGLPTSYVLTAGECGGCSPLKIIALDNPNIKDAPQIAVFWVRDGADVIMGFFDVKMPSLTVEPNKDIPFTVDGMKTAITFSALDAHGKPLPKAIVDVWYMLGPTWVYYNAGYTGTDGKLLWLFEPKYQGAYYATLWNAVLDDYTWPGRGTTYNNPEYWLYEYEEKTQQWFYTKYQAPIVDTIAPVIKVTAPADGSTVTTSAVTVTGTVTDNVGVTALYVGFNKVDVLPDGSFATTINLVAGENTIKLQAYDKAGNKADLLLKVTYKVEVKKAIVIVLTIGMDVVTVNGKATSIDAAPEIVEGRTFVPIRFIAETFGATVEWIPETKGITITLGKHVIGLQIGNATAVVDGKVVALPAAPYIKNGRTMVPLRLIAEAFGGDVKWDPITRTITITYYPE